MSGFNRSPLFYMGDKYKLLPEISKHFPNNINRFIEPFTGGGSVYLNIDANEYLLNDIDSEIVALHKFLIVSASDPEAFFKKVIKITKTYNLSRSFVEDVVPEKLKKEFGSGLEVFFISVDSNFEKVVPKFLKKNNQDWNICIPTWRNDIERSEDLVEEIIRIFGYEKIPINVLPIKSYITKPSLGHKQRLSLYSRKCLSTRGFNEVITFSFLDKLNAKQF